MKLARVPLMQRADTNAVLAGDPEALASRRRQLGYSTHLAPENGAATIARTRERTCPLDS